MPVTITTGGPLTDPDAPTLGDLMTIVADEVDDTTGEYTTQIQNSILEAIRYCDSELFYFNETRDVLFSTVDGQEWYGLTDSAFIPSAGNISSAYSESASGQRTMLRKVRPHELEHLADNSATRGEPYSWAYFDQQIRLYPIPNATVHTIRLITTPYAMDPLTGPSDSNAWITEAQDMVKARAKYNLYKNVLKDPPLAMEALNDFNDQRDVLRAKTSKRQGTGRIVSTCF